MTDLAFHTALEALEDTPFRAYRFPTRYYSESPFGSEKELRHVLSYMYVINDSVKNPIYVDNDEGFSEYLALVQNPDTDKYYGRIYQVHSPQNGGNTLWVDPFWSLYHPHQVTKFYQACHCGEPVTFGYDGNPEHTRGLCEDCDMVRCDAYPGECGK